MAIFVGCSLWFACVFIICNGAASLTIKYLMKQNNDYDDLLNSKMGWICIAFDHNLQSKGVDMRRYRNTFHSMSSWRVIYIEIGKVWYSMGDLPKKTAIYADNAKSFFVCIARQQNWRSKHFTLFVLYVLTRFVKMTQRNNIAYF